MLENDSPSSGVSQPFNLVCQRIEFLIHSLPHEFRSVHDSLRTGLDGVGSGIHLVELFDLPNNACDGGVHGVEVGGKSLSLPGGAND